MLALTYVFKVAFLFSCAKVKDDMNSTTPNVQDTWQEGVTLAMGNPITVHLEDK